MEQAPQTPEVYELIKDDDSSWERIIAAAYREGSVTYQYEGSAYTLTIEDLQNDSRVL